MLLHFLEKSVLMPPILQFNSMIPPLKKRCLTGLGILTNFSLSSRDDYSFWGIICIILLVLDLNFDILGVRHLCFSQNNVNLRRFA